MSLNFDVDSNLSKKVSHYEKIVKMCQFYSDTSGFLLQPTVQGRLARFRLLTGCGTVEYRSLLARKFRSSSVGPVGPRKMNSRSTVRVIGGWYSRLAELFLSRGSPLPWPARSPVVPRRGCARLVAEWPGESGRM
jgi:hypothetical protein